MKSKIGDVGVWIIENAKDIGGWLLILGIVGIVIFAAYNLVGDFVLGYIQTGQTDTPAYIYRMERQSWNKVDVTDIHVDGEIMYITVFAREGPSDEERDAFRAEVTRVAEDEFDVPYVSFTYISPYDQLGQEVWIELSAFLCYADMSACETLNDTPGMVVPSEHLRYLDD